MVSRQYISVPDLWHRAPPPNFKVFQLRFYSTIPTSRSLLLVIFNRCLFFPLHRITKLRSLHSPTRPWPDLPVDAAPRAWPRQVEACWSYTNQPRWLDQNQGAPPLGLALDRLTPVPVSMSPRQATGFYNHFPIDFGATACAWLHRCCCGSRGTFT